MVGWHCKLSEHKLSKLEDSEGQGSPECCSSRGLKDSDMTEQLNSNSN